VTGNEWLAIGPFIVVIALALVIVLADMIWPKRDNLVTAIAVTGILAAMALTVVAGPLGPVGLLPVAGQQVFHGVYVRDQLTAFLDLTFLSIALLTLLFAPDFSSRFTTGVSPRSRARSRTDIPVSPLFLCGLFEFTSAPRSISSFTTSTGVESDPAA
jgi:hypothetical protein